jgi:hypothetical protein
MSKNKNQHFVPKCLLKPFSLDGEGRALNLFNISRGRAVQNTSVKGQCSKSFFYGKDLRLEYALSKNETLYTGAVNKLLDSGAVDASDLYILKSFVLLQYFRSEQSIEIQKRQSADFIEAASLGKTDAVFRDHDDIVRLVMRIFVDSLYIVDDLRACVCEARGNSEFVISDDPAILTNKLNAQKIRQISFGLHSSGILFFLPLSPRYLLLVYDPNVYRIEATRGICKVSGRDVEALNELQYIRADKNIYFSNWNNRNLISDRSDQYRVNRPEKWSETEVYVKDEDNIDTGSIRYRKGDEREAKTSLNSLISIRPVHLYPAKWASILKYKSRPKMFSTGSSVGFIRPAMIEKQYMMSDGIIDIP